MTKQGSCCGSGTPNKPTQESCCGTGSVNKSAQESCCGTGTAKKTTINRQMTIESILNLFPNKAQRLAQEITNAGLHCVGCSAATWETLEVGMMTHGFGSENIDKLVDRLNALLAEEEATGDVTTITITPRAAQKYLQILQEEGKQGWGMRFAERMAGCNGFEYALDYSEKALHDDDTFVSSGIQVHVNQKMTSRLKGSIIDFVDGIRGSGFKISNPNVKSACGCGTSHNY